MIGFHDLPATEFKKDRWLEIVSVYPDHYMSNCSQIGPIYREHYTSKHPENAGAYIIEFVDIGN